MPPDQSSRIQSVDVVRLMAIFAVIVIHTMPFFNTYPWPGRDVSVGYVVNQLARFAVPFFFVMSGYFWGMKIGAGSTVMSTTTKMAKKIAMVFLAWSAIYLLQANPMKMFQHGFFGLITIVHRNALVLLDHPLTTLMEGAKVHLWFLVSLLYCLAISAAFVSQKMTKGLLALSVVLYVVGLLGKAYADAPIGFHSAFNFRNGPFFGLIFFATGYTLSQSEPRASWTIVGGSLAAFGALMHLAELAMLRWLWGTSGLQDYVVGTYFMGLGVALIALSNPPLLRLERLSKTGTMVLGIYAIHFVFVDLLRPVTAGMTDVAWREIGYPVAVFVLSLAATHALSHFRLTKPLVA